MSKLFLFLIARYYIHVGCSKWCGNIPLQVFKQHYNTSRKNKCLFTRQNKKKYVHFSECDIKGKYNIIVYVVLILWWFDWFWFLVFNATFNNISAISWRPVLVVEEAGVPRFDSCVHVCIGSIIYVIINILPLIEGVMVDYPKLKAACFILYWMLLVLQCQWCVLL